MHVVFDKAIHLNLDSKLKKFGIPKHQRIEFLRDVFDNLAEIQMGIVDADS